MSSTELEAQPIACALSSGDRQSREAAWESVIAAALREKRAIDGGVRLEFEPRHDVTHLLADLVSSERECCAWASWALIGTASTTAVEVTAQGAGAQAARELFGLS